MQHFLSKVFNRLALFFADLSRKIARRRSKCLSTDQPRSLYRTPANDLFWLNQTGYLDTCLIEEGIFEKRSTEILPFLVRQGHTVLDVGANIGYYTVLMSRLVGPQGRVLAFEPTKHFGEILHKNLSENNITNVEIIPLGLSNTTGEVQIDIGPSSATIHSPEGYDDVIGHERINLISLDQFAEERNLGTIDFIKIDVDGHEPLFFDGAWKVLEKCCPTILCEISHLHYLQAGTTAWDFYRKIQRQGYFIYNEDRMKIMDNETKFLRKCANFDKTSNIILTKTPLDYKGWKKRNRL